MGRERTEGERRAAEEFADAVRPDTVRFFEAFVNAAFEEVRRNPEVLRLRSEPLREEEADRLALAAVHRARVEHPREPEAQALTQDEVKAWADERRRRERGSGRPGT